MVGIVTAHFSQITIEIAVNIQGKTFRIWFNSHRLQRKERLQTTPCFVKDFFRRAV